jgi:hypothetical protein
VAEERRRQYADGAAQLEAYWRRAAEVTSRVRVAGAELCGDETRAALGVAALSREDVPRLFGTGGFWGDFRESFAASLGVGDRVLVLHVVPGGVGAAAGFLPGDVIVALDLRQVRDGEQLAALQAGDLPDPFEVRIDRSGTERVLTVPFVAECGYELALLVSAFPNAFTDGRTIYATTGLLREVSSDDELALLVGHELAHNVLGDSFTSFKKVEQEADYLGCYFAARAGYDVSGAAAFWRRLAREYPALVSESASYSHSGTAARAAALARTVAEIEEKRRAGAPLLPNLSP